ncbi:hypothetical protein [Endozoicomonas sp. 8E]|uniref:hypothetical protein n=1 Tax=Endozoicomonas sp. 8E TaxID=3035692 RepID=UPI002938F21D|nr:hypothetical protein [Endozoicomonas sp. 8E]WOG27129.1 hypothetical protein P6910_21640 [Endozoicomonas sp. 8E]
MSFSVICHAEQRTEHSTVELQQIAASPKQSPSMRQDRNTLPGKPSDIADTFGYKRSSSPLDNKRHKNYGLTIIESISWQWLYASHLLVTHELILTTKNAAFSYTPYSWVPVGVVVAVGWLLESYWNRNSPSFNSPIAQQTALMLTQGSHQFAIITMMFGNGHNQQQNRPSESSGQQASGALSHPAGSFARPLYIRPGGDNGPPQQHIHTLGLNCFVYPCHGVCQFRLSLDTKDSGTLSFFKSSTDHTEAPPGQSSCHNIADGYCLPCMVLFHPVYAGGYQQESLLGPMHAYSGYLLLPFHPGPLSKPQAYGIGGNPRGGVAIDEVALDPVSARSVNTTGSAGPLNHEGPIPGNLNLNTDDFMDIIEAYDLQNLLEETGISFTYDQASRVQASVAPDNVISKTTECQQTLSDKETRKLTCDVTVIEEDDQQRPCGKACNSAKALYRHKRRAHTGQQTCDVALVGENGRPQLCGSVCKNVVALSEHKRRYHNGQKICDLTAILENGRRRPCGKAFQNARFLSDHKRKVHMTQKTCHMIVIEEDGQQRPCGRVYKNANSLSNHRQREHNGQKTCNSLVVGKDGKLRRCGTVYKNSKTLSDHRKKHRER